ncbi:MAG: BamA/TamA family outer membrane protein [Saprospiraceae bacterium]|nr:BamA/TamA family outer membrane protein [Saprospiraceae bacterium]
MGVLYVYVAWILCLPAISQKGLQFHFFIDQKQSTEIFPKIRDTAELSHFVHQWVLLQQTDGYLLAGLDSIKYRNDEVSVYLFKGTKYQWNFKEVSELDLSFEDHVSRFKAVKTDAEEIFTDEFKQWVLHHAESGYPFALAHLYPLSLAKDTLQLRFHLEKGEAFTFGPIQQGDKPLFKNYVIQKISGISPGSLFSHSKIHKSVQRISRLANVQQEAEPFIYFPGNMCVVKYYIKENKSSKFDFLLGLNPFDGPNGREYRLTGLGNLQLYNLFKLSEDIYLKYENLNDNAPKFLLNLKFPFLPYLPFGIQYDLSLFRYREAYFDFKHQAFMEFPLDMNSGIGVSLMSHSSDLVNPDTNYLILQKRLPPVLDFNYFSVGVRISHQNLNHLWLPTKGSKLIAELHYGKKSYATHPLFLEYESEQIKVQEQFDSLNLNDRQARFRVQLDNYTGVGNRSVIKMAFTSEGFLGNSFIVDNERFRLGGAQNLRGFDEDFYLASAYAMASLEYRYLLDRQSYLSLFHDLGFLRQNEKNSEIWNTYNGSGLGIHFTTPVGLFSLQYAIGTSPDVSFNLGNGKIHFGYSALF